MKTLNVQQVEQVSGGWAWVAVGAAANTANYVISTPKSQRSARGYAIAAATGAVGGGTAKAGKALWQAGYRVRSSVQAGNTIGMGAAGGLASR